MRKISFLILVLPLLIVVNKSWAGERAHYVSGIEGIRCGTVPGPGLYYKSYNAIYHADKLTDKDGDRLPIDFDVTVFASAHRFILVSSKKFLGADIFADFTIPLIYTDIEIGAANIDKNRFGLGDVCIEPIGLAWHGNRYDVAIAPDIYLPVGDYDQDDPSSPGQGFWTFMLTYGGTYYLDREKTWSVSALGRYEINSNKRSTDVRPGQVISFEWGLGKNLAKLWDIGLTGYCHWQITDDHGNDVTWDKDVHDRVFAVGPEISYFIPALKLGLSLRSSWEFGAVDCSEGNITTLTIVKVF